MNRAQPLTQHTASAQRLTSARTWLYAVLEEGQVETPLGRVVEALLIVLIICNVITASLETVPSIDAVFHNWFSGFEKISILAYTVEYGLRLWSCMDDPRIARYGPVRGRLSFALRPFMVIDFIAFAPSYLSIFLPFDLRVLRIFRLFRLLKLARYSQALPALLAVLYAERAALFASIILLLSTVCAGAELMHFAEGAIQPKVLGTIPDAMYWAVETLTTVGYGDITPITPLGKMITAVFMVLGLALFALPIGIIANGFINGLHRRRFAITWSLMNRLPLFSGLDPDALNDLMEALNASIVREHGHIAIGGEAADTLCVVVSGRAHVEDGTDQVYLEPGSVTGQQALYRGQTYAHTITAVTDMRLIELPADDLRRLSRKHPVLRDRLQPAADALADRQDAPQRLAALEDENARLREAIVRLTLERNKLTAG